MSVLFSPLEIKGLRFKNRIVFPPITTCFATHKAEVTEKMMNYYAERARGGAAMLILEPGVTSPYGKLNPRSMGIYEDRFVDPLARLVEGIKRHDALAFIQLCHAGPRARALPPNAQPVSSSDVPIFKGVVPKPLEAGEISRIVEEFVLAARRAARAGFDGVEIHGAHFYLLSNFLSPLTNRRRDGYGGDAAGRARIICEIIGGIKQVCGSGFPVIVRYHTREMGEGALDPAGSAALGREFAAAGADILHLSSWFLPDPALEAVMTIPATSIPGEDAPEGCFLEHTAAVKREVSLPVIGVGKIIDPAVAGQALAEGKCDLVAVGRGLVADPDWPAKAAAGEQIRRCRSCKACINSLASGEMVCSVNPDLKKTGIGN
ncbi:MAG: hypothetical protein ACOY40_11760 [Bacillota bacterium]